MLHYELCFNNGELIKKYLLAVAIYIILKILSGGIIWRGTKQCYAVQLLEHSAINVANCFKLPLHISWL